jgi:hypothetical protein
MIVEGQDHERRIGDDPVEKARVHRKELAGLRLCGIAQSGKRIGRAENGRSTHVRSVS